MNEKSIPHLASSRHTYPEGDFFVVHQKMRISEDAHDEDKHLEDGKQHVLKDFLPSSSFNVNIDTYGTYLFDSAP